VAELDAVLAHKPRSLAARLNRAKLRAACGAFAEADEDLAAAASLGGGGAIPAAALASVYRERAALCYARAAAADTALMEAEAARIESARGGGGAAAMATQSRAEEEAAKIEAHRKLGRRNSLKGHESVEAWKAQAKQYYATALELEDGTQVGGKKKTPQPATAAVAAEAAAADGARSPASSSGRSPRSLVGSCSPPPSPSAGAGRGGMQGRKIAFSGSRSMPLGGHGGRQRAQSELSTSADSAEALHPSARRGMRRGRYFIRIPPIDSLSNPALVVHPAVISLSQVVHEPAEPHSQP